MDLRDWCRNKFAEVVPERPYAKNIEKMIYKWAKDETKRQGDQPAMICLGKLVLPVALPEQDGQPLPGVDAHFRRQSPGEH